MCRPSPHLGAGGFVVLVMDDVVLEDPPAVPLPVLTLDEARDVVEVLAAVVNGGVPDAELAAVVLSNLAARIPSAD